MAYIYGLIPVLEALKANRRPIEEIILAEGNRPARLTELLNFARQKKVLISHHKRSYLDNLVNGANHQGVIAIARSAASFTDLEDVLANAGKNPLFVLLDNVEDPHNLGAIIRTSECAGANAVIIPTHHSVGLTETVVKSSVGATEYLPVVQVTNLVHTIDELKSKNIWVVGLEANTSTNYTGWDFQTPTAIVLGSEGKGIRRLVKEHCDSLVSIPLLGKVTSLNVSVAAAVILYEAVRQRQSLRS
ncbi:MAG: 23S rRNA (guanosine(2251)-2'-O)-methyltransferase RlmB [Acidobacteria bacterium]|nr:23S rRNA (guanosine(2251)-2'-O)-methyltransferase RlmB [Acidobacteriota bacterium]